MDQTAEAKVGVEGEGVKMPKGEIFGMKIEELTMVVGALMANKDAAKQMVDVFKPVIGEVIDLALDTVGPEAYKVVSRVSLGVADVRKAVFDKYVASGFTEEQAMRLLLADIAYSKQVNEAASKAMKG